MFSLSSDAVPLASETSTSTVTLTNSSGGPVAFKVRMTHPGHTTAKPAKGDIAGGGSISFEISVKSGWGELVNANPPPRMLVQCLDTEAKVLWKQRLNINVGGAPAPAASSHLAVETDSGSMMTPDASPVTSPKETTKFNIHIAVHTLTAPGALSGAKYSIHWKRGSNEGSTQAFPLSSSNSVVFNQNVDIMNCSAVFRDGRAMKKYLVFTVMQDGAPVGSLKLLASECAPGEKSAELPITIANNGTEQQCSLGMVVAMEFAQQQQQQQQQQPRPTVAAPAATPATPNRKFVDIPVASTPNHDSEPSDFANPLEAELSPIREAPVDQNIQVLVRVRPGDPGDCVWKTDPSTATVTDDEKSHDFDYIFPQTSTNINVWDTVGPRFIDAVTTGINGTIFMYGQTGSGKTHTMFGKQGELGLTPMLFQNLFKRIGELGGGATSFEVAASYFEIYNEQLNDLLVTDSKKGRDLKLRSRPDGSFSVPDLVVEKVHSMEACQRLLEQGGKRKVMGYSHLNQESSRSHTIFSITVICNTEGSGKKAKKTATLNFCDLAGSESMTMDGDQGQKKETVNINKSLTYLKNVIKQLAEGGKHVSYRNSTLTRILKQSLGGNARTSIIITIHPGREQQKDSKNSLFFGSMARTVKNRARVNAEYEGANLKQQVKRLQAQLKALASEVDPLRQVRDDYLLLRDEYESLADENSMLRNGASLQQTMDKRIGFEGAAEATPSTMSVVAPGREEALLKKINEKDREIIDLKLNHSRELMNKTVQLQKALEEQEAEQEQQEREHEQEQEETALEIMQKDDRLDQLVYQILSYLHYGTKVTSVASKGETTRMLLYLVTDQQSQHVCLSPLDENAKGITEDVVMRLSVRDLKKVTMGQYGSAFAKAQKSLSKMFERSLTIETKKKKMDIVTETQSDFEAWIQSLNHLMRKERVDKEAEWGGPLELSGMAEYQCLDDDEKKLCTQMHIPPVDYINARSQVLNKEGKFVTLFDVRTLSCLDMFHSQKLFSFFMKKRWIGHRKLYFLDTEEISKTANLYDVEYEDDDEEEAAATEQPSNHFVYRGSQAQPPATTGYSGASHPPAERTHSSG